MDARAIFPAIQKSDIDTIKNLLAANVDLTIANENNLTPVEYAAKLGHTTCLKLIAESQEASADDNERSGKRYGSALYLTIAADNTEMSLLLIKQKASLVWYGSTDKNGLLHLAIKSYKNNKIIIKKLIEHKINLAHENSSYQTPMQLAHSQALSTNNWEIVDWIARCVSLENNANDVGKFGEALVSAVQLNLLTTAEYLLKAGASVNKGDNEENTCLHIAISNRYLPMLKLLLSYHPNFNLVNQKKQNPLQLAFASSQWDCVDILLQHTKLEFKDPHQGGEYLLKIVKEKQYALVKPCTQAGAALTEQTEPEKNSCLHLAVTNDDHIMVNLLLECDINRTLTNKNWRTAAELACELSHWDCVQEIIQDDLKKQKTADVKYIQEMHYEECLFIAIQKGNYAITKLLMQLKVPCTKENSKMGNIAIYWALKNNNKDILALLLQEIDLTKVNTNQDNKDSLAIAKDLKATNCYSLLSEKCVTNSLDVKSDLLYEKCVATLKNLQISISLYDQFQKKTLFGKWVNGKPPYITSIANLLAKYDYSKKSQIWNKVVQIATLFTAESMTTDRHPYNIQFDNQEIAELKNLQSLRNQQNLYYTNQIILSTLPTLSYCPVNTMISTVNIQPPSYEQVKTAHIAAIKPINNLLLQETIATNAITESDAIFNKKLQELPKVPYSALGDLNLFAEKNNVKETAPKVEALLPSKVSEYL